MKMGYDAVTYGDRWFSAEITEKYTRTKHGKNRLGEQAYTIWSQGHFNNLNAKTNYYFCRGVFGKYTFASVINLFNRLTAKLFNLNFHPLEVVSR